MKELINWIKMYWTNIALCGIYWIAALFSMLNINAFGGIELTTYQTFTLTGSLVCGMIVMFRGFDWLRIRR